MTRKQEPHHPSPTKPPPHAIAEPRERAERRIDASRGGSECATLRRVSTGVADEGAGATQPTWHGWLVGHLEPGERLGEILFGLVMVLTFTLGAGLSVPEGQEGVRELLVAAIGCNVAWGLIDAAIYVMNRMSERGRRLRLARGIRAAASPAAGLALVRRELDPVVAPLAGAELRERLYAEVRERVAETAVERNRLRSEDLYGAIASFWLVFLSAIPAALPFALLSNPRLALRVSNLLLLCLLFLVGWRWAGYTGASRAATGLAMLGIGLALVGVAIALGG
jgi:hypothetical protein